MTAAQHGNVPGDGLLPGPGLARKVFYTALTGLLTFGISAALQGPLDVPLSQQILLGTLVGGVTLLTQFLHDFEQRIHLLELRQEENLRQLRQAIDSGFATVSEASRFLSLVEESPVNTGALTALVHAAGRICADRPELVLDLAHHELDRVTTLLRSLGDGHEVFYDGEDREWLLGLAATAKVSIEATSLTTVDAGLTAFESGLWTSDLGARYLDLQRAAHARGVRIRRIFVFDDSPQLDDGDFEQICELQHASGVEVRRLDAATVPAHLKNLIFDFIVFDGVLSYETTPATRMDASARPAIVTTRLVLDPDRVRGRRDRFEALWAAAAPVPPPSAQPSEPAQPPEPAQPSEPGRPSEPAPRSQPAAKRDALPAPQPVPQAGSASERPANA